MRLVDETFLEMPLYGARQMARHLRAIYRIGTLIDRTGCRNVFS